MTKHVLNIGEVKTVSSQVTFTCFGLGSCIGLFVQDRTAGISGGAHILLPDDTQPLQQFDGRCYNVIQALDKLLEQFLEQGSQLTALRAKITGGAQFLKAGVNVGGRNAASIVDHLIRRRIYIAAADVGGTYSRTVNFCSKTSQMKVKHPETNSYTIF